MSKAPHRPTPTCQSVARGKSRPTSPPKIAMSTPDMSTPCDTCLQRETQCVPIPGCACIECKRSKLKCTHTPLKHQRSGSRLPSESRATPQPSTSSQSESGTQLHSGARAQSSNTSAASAKEVPTRSSPPMKKQSLCQIFGLS
jgi:hypothetical protein